MMSTCPVGGQVVFRPPRLYAPEKSTPAPRSKEREIKTKKLTLVDFSGNFFACIILLLSKIPMCPLFLHMVPYF